MKICSVLDCGRKHLAKGYCGRHLQQIYKYGKIVSSGRSKLDSNEITIIDNIAYMKLYDIDGCYVNETIFDANFADIISDYKWYYNKETGYVCSSWLDNGVWRPMSLHRFLIYLTNQDIGENFEVDHKDTNRLINLISNLRICTTQQNNQNSTKDPTKFFSEYKGVTKHQKNFRAHIYVNRKGIYLGYFKNEIDAARAYNVAAIKHFGEFAKLNDI